MLGAGDDFFLHFRREIYKELAEAGEVIGVAAVLEAHPAGEAPGATGPGVAFSGTTLLVGNRVYVDAKLKDYIVDIVFATREPGLYGLDSLERLIDYGASPRASIYLAQAAKVQAFMAGDTALALALHEQLLPLCKALFCTTNPIPVKAAL